MSQDYLFTSESVSEGHPDKVADQISDAILDAILEQDPYARVAAETLCNTGLVVLAGEITTTANIDYISVARDTIKRIGYDNNDYGIDHRGCAVLVGYDKQSPDIAQGVDEGRGIDLDQGAGDQGLMFGYACDETPELMPAAIYYAHRLVERQSQLRKDGRIAWLRPDAKSQVTLRYVDGKPVAAETIVLSTQHAPEVEHKQIEEAVIEEIIKPVMPAEWLKDTKYLVNPTGRFVIGGPQGDCGLTGRKIIVDTYGGSCPHGGGAFSGKDPSKVVRQPMPHVMSPRISLPQDWPKNARFRSAMLLVLPDRSISRSILKVPVLSLTARSPLWSTIISICVRRALCKCLTCCIHATSRRLHTDTSVVMNRNLPGKKRIKQPICVKLPDFNRFESTKKPACRWLFCYVNADGFSCFGQCIDQIQYV